MFWNNKSTPALQKLNKLWGFLHIEPRNFSSQSEVIPNLQNLLKNLIYTVYIFILSHLKQLQCVTV